MTLDLNMSREALISLAANPVGYLNWIQLALAAAGVFLVYQAGSIAWTYWRHTRSPLRKIPGPEVEGTNWLTGNQRVLFDGEGMSNLEKWEDAYGGTFTLRSTLGSYQLVTTDTRALTHILFATSAFHKPMTDRRNLTIMLGESILVTEGEQHRDHRRILNPAFGYAHVREMTESFVDVSLKMREIWHSKCVAAGGTVKLDVLHWLSKAALDSIGKAGFDYDFGGLSGRDGENELAVAFDRVFRADNTPTIQLRILVESLFPIVRAIFPSSRAREIDESKKMMDDIGMRIVQERKQAVLSNMTGGRIDRKAVGGKDLISLLIQANLAEDVSPSQKLSDAEVMAQIPSFIVAGHETTANSTTWAMYAMAMYPETQKKLRHELLQVGTEHPSLDALNALPYLDKVVRETLRFHTVATFIGREAVKDDVVPFERPIKDVDGNLHSQLRLRKGDQVLVPIWLVNRSKHIWGPDADQFRPERWDEVPSEASSIPGITPNLMSFVGGPRACIGHRFAVAEMKALLFHIVRGFEFTLGIEDSQIWSRTGNLLRPQLRKDNTVQLPMLLTPVAA